LRFGARRPEGSDAWKDEGVHVTIVRVSTGDQDIANATIVGEEMLRWLRDLEGFLGSLMLSRHGTTLTLSFWESAELAARHSSVRGEFRQRITDVVGVELVDVEEFEVTFAHLGALMVGS
jgi:hypothetical protein